MKIKKISLLSWDKICRPKEEGGADIKNIHDQSRALGAKLVWIMSRHHHLKWVRILYHKYFKEDNPIQIFRENNPPRGSRIWNFMLECRNIITDKLTWNLRSREDVLFWSDSWGWYMAIEKIHDFGPTRALLESNRGKLIGNYISPSEDGAGWKWIVRENEDIPVREKEKLMAILKDINISFSLGKDRLVWDGSMKWEYNSKDGYNHITKAQLRPKMELPVKLCWDRYCLPKARVFTWLALQNKLLIAENFRRMGYEGPSRCPLCEKDEEDTNHLLLNCNHANQCWVWFTQKLGWSSAFP